MASSPIALILGAGPNVGHHVAQAFFTQGYKVALASRKANEAERTPTQVNIACDLSDIASVPGVFEKVKAALGTPSVVVYNAAAVTPNDPKNPLELPVSDFIHDLRINTASAYVAAQQATLAFAQLPDTASKTFIYTGNILNTTIMVPLMDLGVGKAATASWLRCAAEAYGEQGSKFYYADERKEDGSAAFKIDGEAHAQLYTKLAETREQGPWQQTFVKGVGYKAF